MDTCPSAPMLDAPVKERAVNHEPLRRTSIRHLAGTCRFSKNGSPVPLLMVPASVCIFTTILFAGIGFLYTTNGTVSSMKLPEP